MAWRDSLDQHEQNVVNSAGAGSLIRKLAELLDQMEAQSGAPALRRFTEPGVIVPSNLVRLDE